MKKMKRLLAAVLSVAMIAGLFAVIEPETAEAAMPTTEYFNETFSTDGAFDNETYSSSNNDAGESNLSLWKSYVKDGKLIIPADNTEPLYLMVNDSKIMCLSDYIVSCTVQFEELPEDRSSLVNVGIVARTGNIGDDGYELQLTIPATEEAPFVRLRNRGVGKYYTSKCYLEDFVYTEENTFEIECRGDNIVCFVNGESVLTYTVSDGGMYAGDTSGTYTTVYDTGAAAIRMVSTSIGADVIFDNFKVYHNTDYKFSDDFDDYDESATDLEKKAELNAKGWYVANKGNADLLSGGSYTVSKENTTNPIVLQTENAKGALGWKNYTVEADITIGSTNQTLSSAVYACVTGRHTVAGGNDGYEIQFYGKVDGTTYLRIYARNAGGSLEQCTFSLENGRTYNLKAVFYENKISAYVDDVLYIEATDDSYPIGFAGIKKNGVKDEACGMDVKFDNFVVYDAPMFSDYFQEYVPTLGSNGYELTQTNAKGWYGKNNSTTRPQVAYFNNGAFRLPTDNTTAIDLVLNKVDDSANWENYVVESEIVFNSTGVSADSGVYTYFMISGRETAYINTGYGLVLGVNNSGHLRYVYLYKNGKLATVNAENDVVSYDESTSKFRAQAGTKIVARLEFNGTKINGYINGIKRVSLTLEEDEVTSGYAGMHTVSVSGKSVSGDCVDIIVDNYKIYELDQELIGDIYNDDIVNATDTEMLQDYLVGKTYDETMLDADALDANKSTTVDIKDYVRMMRLVDSLQ